MSRRLGVAVAALFVMSMAAWFLASRHRPLPPPTEIAEEEGDDFAQRRAAWIEAMHRHAPNTNWRAIDTQTRSARQARLRETAGIEQVSAAPAGTWHERGARNQAGRMSDVDYDAATDRLTAFSHGGQLWRSQRASLAWQPLNDARQFHPQDRMQHFKRLSGTPERWLAADDSQGGFFYSDNQGATWLASGGSVPVNWLDTSYLVSRDAAGAQVYALVGDYNFSASDYQSRLLVSADRGASFTDLGFVGSRPKTALVALANGQVFLLVGNVLKRIETTNVLTTVSTLTAAPSQSGGESVGLAGGIAAGTPFFFAFFESGGAMKVLRSLDGGVGWALRGTVPTGVYIRMAVGTSLHDPNLVFCGGVNLYRSVDGGLNFSAVNDWSEYYGNVASKLHADISFVTVFPDSGGNDIFFVGTDGGLYQSTDGLASVSNLTLSGMRQAQYYDSYSGRSPPYAIAVGAQDQGYQRARRPSSGIANFTQSISGDYAHLTSSDGGATIWMNYPNFTLIDAAPTSNSNAFVTWQFSSLNLQNMLFLAPIMADPADSHVAWLAGGASGAGGNRVIRLAWDGATTVTPTEGTFEFGGQVTALSYSLQSPATRFALADAPGGGSSRFFRTTTPGAAWTAGATGLPSGQFFYGTTIVADPVRANTIYVGGSGYSGPAVYVSTNNGDNFVAMSTGLPGTLVYTMAISPDGNHLFAATEVGPYYYDRAGNTWVDISSGAPDNVYWHVDYIPALRTARFSTYGRGLWDFDLGGGDLIFRDGLE